MEKACLPAEFQQSYLDYLSYPRNLILRGTKTYHSTLETYKDRLDAIEADLCLTNEKDVLVPIRDLHGVSGNGTREQLSNPPFLVMA
jgi:hypothetical protein